MKIIIADEPTGSVDIKSKALIMKLLKSINENGTTIIVVTHDNNVAKEAKTKLELVLGKLTKRKQSDYLL